MTTGQLAARLGVAQKNVVALEQREAEGAVTLASLERAAQALGCELIYALVPRESLEALRAHQADRIARRRLAQVAHSMALEGQAVGEDEMDRQREELAEDLLRRWPAGFWDLTDDELR